MSHQDAALVIAGHGSTINADSSRPTFDHAHRIRQRGLFAEVHECFWKEEPNFRQILRAVECDRIYIVPNFISEGYFTEQVIPRELGLEGRITVRGGQETYYCDPVGIHPAMVDVLLSRAQEVVARSGEPLLDPRQSTCLFLVGHGTSLNDHSTRIIHQRAAEIQRSGMYAECHGALMEQSPFIAEWRALTGQPDVVVVPFFISDGLHSYEDIPVLLGISENPSRDGYPVPFHEGRRRLWYATAIGTEPLVADVILAQVRHFDENYRALPALA
jgi:sirohydrochlorin cobaltochelatase